VLNLEYRKIINYLREFSNSNKRDGKLINFIESIIIKTGKALYQNNIEITDISNRKKVYIVLENKIKQTLLNNLKKQRIFYIQQPNINSSQSFNYFFKFLHLFFSRLDNYHILFLTRSGLLKNREVVLNIYNLDDVNFFADFLDLIQMFNSIGIHVLNINQNSRYINHLSFLNPTTEKFLNYSEYKKTIFDFVVGNELSIEKIGQAILKLKEKLTEYYIMR